MKYCSMNTWTYTWSTLLSKLKYEAKLVFLFLSWSLFIKEKNSLLPCSNVLYTEFTLSNQTIWLNSWCCICKTSAISDQGGIQKNNYNFPGAEKKTYYPDEGRGLVRSNLRPFLDKLSMEIVLVHILFAGKWTSYFSFSHKHTLPHAYTFTARILMLGSLNILLHIYTYSVFLHMALVPCALITAPCTYMILCSHLALKCI